MTNQKSSGRCWLFATTNVVRTGIVKKFNLGASHALLRVALKCAWLMTRVPQASSSSRSPTCSSTTPSRRCVDSWQQARTCS